VDYIEVHLNKNAGDVYNKNVTLRSTGQAILSKDNTSY
jgi:hypothetical protein